MSGPRRVFGSAAEIQITSNRFAFENAEIREVDAGRSSQAFARRRTVAWTQEKAPVPASDNAE
jgi:hypothetical protein